MDKKVTVGDLRQQCALSDSDRPVIIVSDDAGLEYLEVVSVYPDTTDGDGFFNPTFKIKVKKSQ